MHRIFLGWVKFNGFSSGAGAGDVAEHPATRLEDTSLTGVRDHRDMAE